MNIHAENPLEKKIIESSAFREALPFGKSTGEGHKEDILGEHIFQILAFIERMPWQTYKGDLRILALLHDLGKVKTEYRDGVLVGKGHAEHSVEIAREFTSDKRMLELIRIHDKYFGFYKDMQKGRFNQEKLARTYANQDMETLIRFNYADSNNRSKGSLVWFEDKCVELGLRQQKIYQINPEVLR